MIDNHTDQPGQIGGDTLVSAPQFYTTAEVAALLRIQPESVVKRIYRGQLEAVKSGNRWLFRKDLIDAMLQPTAPQER
jgi:excisionase family DNA binding protein